MSAKPILNETIELIQSHRSIRRFSGQKIEPSLLQQLLLAGQSASTSSYIQATSVIRVTDKEKRAELAELAGKQTYVESAAEFLVFCADLHRNDQRVTELGEDVDYHWTEQFLAATVDVALYAQNTVLAAQSLGLGCCYIGGIRNDPNKVSDLLALPDLVYPVFGLCIGYPDQNPEQKPRLPLSVQVFENTYQSCARKTNPDVANIVDDFDAQIKNYYIERSKGKLDFNWSQQMATQASSQTRPFMREFLQKKGFINK